MRSRFAIAFGIAIIATSAAASDDAKVLKPSDLAVETSKWDGRVVETTLNCFYADRNEFRCLDAMSGGVRVDFREFDTDGQAYLEKNCDEIDKISSPRCRVTIRFTYASHSRMEGGGLLGHITVVAAENDVGIIVRHPK
jgi:hypothetical protein